MSGTFARIASKAAAVARSAFERWTADSSSASGDALGSVIRRADAGVLRKTFARGRVLSNSLEGRCAAGAQRSNPRASLVRAGAHDGDPFRILAKDRGGRSRGEARPAESPFRLHPRKS